MTPKSMAGFVFAQLGTRSLTAIFWWAHLDVGPDLRILLFTAAISVGAGLCFGIVPAFYGTQDRASVVPNGAASGLHHAMSPSARRQWFSRLLIVAQVAVATVMLVGSGLLMRTLINLKNVSLGFNAQNLLLFGLDPVSQHYQEPRIETLYRNLRERIAALPGVTAVTYRFRPGRRILRFVQNATLPQLRQRFQRSCTTLLPMCRYSTC